MKKARRINAILLTLLLAVSLMACSKTSTGDSSSAPGTNSGSADTGTDASGNAGSGDMSNEGAGSGETYGADQTLASGFGLFREDFDYSTMPKFSVVGMYNEMNGMYMDIDYYVKIWAERTNCEYTTFDAGKDSDAFITAIETYSNQALTAPSSIPTRRHAEDRRGARRGRHAVFRRFSPAIYSDNSYGIPTSARITTRLGIPRLVAGRLCRHDRGL
jgi:uncharacterized lipoprotein YehR (DUF1307 family)